MFFSLPNSLRGLRVPVLIFAVAAFAGTAQASSSIDIDSTPGKFAPDAIELHVGQTTTLRFGQTDGVHGIQSSDLGIPQTILTPDKTTSIDVTPKKAGTYILHCQIVCGVNHRDMSLTIKVDS